MMDEIKISVIMLTYNREALIGRAIESILKQTFTEFEFIIVDNGSTDHSGKIADQYAEKDSRIHVIHRERGNIGSGRNTGLDAAKGTYIAFIDDDDWCDPDFLEYLYQLAEENRADVSICGASKEDHGVVVPAGVFDELLIMNAKEAVITMMWRKRYNTGFPTKLIKRALFDKNRFAETGQYDDISLMYKILAQSERTAAHGLPKYHVYRHEGNNSSATTKDNLITPEYLESYRTAYRERTEWLCDYFPEEKEYWWYFDWSFQISMVNKIESNRIENCEKHLYEMKQELKEHKEEFLNSPHLLEFEKKWMEEYI